VSVLSLLVLRHWQRWRAAQLASREQAALRQQEPER